MEKLQRWAALVQATRGDRSQRAFAEFLGVSQSTVQSWESGRSLPTLENLDRMAKIRGELPEELVGHVYGRPCLSCLPIEDRIKGMSKEELKQALASIASALF